jgi:Arc/MetJ family transcription regulator
MACLPYFRGMKMTMHIDEETLAEVMKITGVASKTAAVETALREMVRKSRFKRIAKAGLGMTADELKNVWEDPFAEDSLRVAEAGSTYGRKRSRR